MNSARSHYSSVQAKTAFYQANGTGRDTYISTNNGGIVKPMKFLPTASNVSGRLYSGSRTARVRLEGKTVHYHSNGTGRDSYIGFNEGGFSNSPAYRGPNYLSSFRSYEKIRPVTREKIDYFEWAQTAPSMKDFQESIHRGQTVKRMVDRLSRPKSVVCLPAVKRNIFDSSPQ